MEFNIKSVLKNFIPELWLSKNVVVYKGPVPPNKLHLHRALQLIVSPVSEVEIKSDGYTDYLCGNVIIIPPFIRHEVKYNFANCIVMFFEPNSFLFNKFKYSNIITFKSPKNECDYTLNLIKNYPNSISEIVTFGFQKLNIEESVLSRPTCGDQRINTVLDRLESSDTFPKIEELAKSCNVSVSRFIHLFSEQMNMPFKSYYLWLKLRRALLEIKSGNDVTEASYNAGFADSAHFSRTFRHTFGFSPSLLKIMKIRD